MATSTNHTATGQITSCGCFCGNGGTTNNIAGAPPRMKKTNKKPDRETTELAKEMNGLSVEERERVLEEIHGVAQEKEETPEFVAACLEEFDACLSKLSYMKRKDLDRALFLKPSLLNDKEFKLLFLRSEEYNARLAAERMARFFSYKRYLYGENKLVKNITLGDLNQEDIDIYKAGGAPILLPNNDRSGRFLLFFDATEAILRNYRSLMRYNLYQVMNLLQDEVTAQKKGVTMVIFCPGSAFMSKENLPTLSEFVTSFKEGGKLMNNLPFRVTGFHYCYDLPITNFFIGAIRSGMGRATRLRLRVHFGSATELKYSLLTFGIVTEGLICSEDEEDCKPMLREKYLARRRQIEASMVKASEEDDTTTKNLVAFPAERDVLLGRGRPYPEFPGNQRFVGFIDEKRAEYRACDHLFEKTRVIMKVINLIREPGGRFLKRTADGWEVVDEEVVMEKIRKSFRAKPVDTSGREESTRSKKRLKVDSKVDGSNDTLQ